MMESEVIIDKICNNLDFNDAPEMIMVCILLITLFAKCIGPFFASDIEVILMKKKDLYRRTGLAYIIVFGVSEFINFYFSSELIFLITCFTMLVIYLCIYCVIKLYCRFGKKENKKAFLEKHKDQTYMAVIMVFFPIVVRLVSNADISVWGSVTICSLVEVVVIVLGIMDKKPLDAKFVLLTKTRKWYIYKRIDSGVLCGNNKQQKEADEFKIFDLNIIIKSDDYQLKKDTNGESVGECRQEK